METQNINSRPEFESFLRNIFLLVSKGQKLLAIKAIREFSGLGLKESKELYESLPIILPDNNKINDLQNQVENLSDHITELQNIRDSLGNDLSKTKNEIKDYKRIVRHLLSDVDS